jgi:hypothetical protein
VIQTQTWIFAERALSALQLLLYARITQEAVQQGYRLLFTVTVIIIFVTVIIKLDYYTLSLNDSKNHQIYMKLLDIIHQYLFIVILLTVVLYI